MSLLTPPFTPPFTPQSLVERKLEADKKLRQETARYWHEITPLGLYDFDRHTHDAAAVREITQEELAEFWDKFCARASPKRRKASFQVFAAQHLLPPPPAGVTALDSVEQITLFKPTLAVWPAAVRAARPALD